MINTILAVLATFKANERGQSPVLWAAKAFSVGGLAIDQLTQLPTLKEIEELENRKGARAIKKMINSVVHYISNFNEKSSRNTYVMYNYSKTLSTTFERVPTRVVDFFQE